MKRLCALLTLSLLMNDVAATPEAQGRLYDCAANCLYLFCSLTSNKISYDKSMELLPMTDKGNSMLDLNNALQKCGFETEAKTIKSEDLGKVKSPSIVLHYPKNKANTVGHFFIIIPHDGKITIYDYPKEVRTYPADFLVTALRQNGVHEFPILMCKAKAKLERGKADQKTTRVESDIIFKGSDKQLMGNLDFGRQPEGSLIRCSFRLINRSSTAIELNDAAADCKCSKIHVDEPHVSPGKSCKITLDISLVKKYKDVAVKGLAKINQGNGTMFANLIMLIKGYSEPRVLCNPQKIDFGSIKTNSGVAKYEGAKVLKTEFAKDHTINSIKPTAPNISVVNMNQNADSVEFDIALDSGDSVGLQTSKINVFLDGESEPANYFDVMALLQMDFTFSPRVAIVKKGRESIVIIIPKEQKFAVEKVLLPGNSNYFSVSYLNGTDYSSIHISIGDKEPPQQLIEDFVEVVIRLKDTKEERVLKIPVIYIPPSDTAQGYVAPAVNPSSRNSDNLEGSAFATRSLRGHANRD